MTPEQRQALIDFATGTAARLILKALIGSGMVVTATAQSGLVEVISIVVTMLIVWIEVKASNYSAGQKAVKAADAAVVAERLAVVNGKEPPP